MTCRVTAGLRADGLLRTVHAVRHVTYLAYHPGACERERGDDRQQHHDQQDDTDIVGRGVW